MSLGNQSTNDMDNNKNVTVWSSGVVLLFSCMYISTECSRHCHYSACLSLHCESVFLHYCDVIMSTIGFRTTSLTIVYSTVYSGSDKKNHQSSASPAFVRRIHRWQVNSPYKGPVTQKMFPFDDVTSSLRCFTKSFEKTPYWLKGIQLQYTLYKTSITVKPLV